MADNSYILEDLIAAGTRFVTDDGTGIDRILVRDLHEISLQAIANGNWAVRVFLTSTTGIEGQSYAEIMQTDPLLYQSVTFTGVIENIHGGAGRELLSGNGLANLIEGDPTSAAGGDDSISGLGGNDTLIGAGGSDRLSGDDGDDHIFGDLDPGAQDQGNIAAGDDSL